jgi:YD repeat-containing protein
LNRLSAATLHNGGSVGYEWHADGLLQRVTYPQGQKREYQYDNADRVTQVRNTARAAHRPLHPAG